MFVPVKAFFNKGGIILKNFSVFKRQLLSTKILILLCNWFKKTIHRQCMIVGNPYADSFGFCHGKEPQEKLKKFLGHIGRIHIAPRPDRQSAETFINE